MGPHSQALAAHPNRPGGGCKTSHSLVHQLKHLPGQLEQLLLVDGADARVDGAEARVGVLDDFEGALPFEGVDWAGVGGWGFLGRMGR
jgi:hypothetical protein